MVYKDFAHLATHTPAQVFNSLNFHIVYKQQPDKLCTCHRLLNQTKQASLVFLKIYSKMVVKFYFFFLKKKSIIEV